MKAALLAGDNRTLSPIAKGAVALLARGIKPASQTRASEFNEASEHGRSEAGKGRLTTRNNRPKPDNV